MQINIHQNQHKREPTHHIPTILISTLTLCLILLSACANNTGNTNSSTLTTIPAPAIDLTTKNQGDTQLLAFQQWITLMQQYNGNTTIYLQQLNIDQQALNSAKTEAAFKSTLAKLNAQVEAIKIPAMKAEIKSLQIQLEQGQSSWGQQHQYHDDYNNTNYQLGFEYGPNGIGGWVQQEFDSAQTLADYQQTIEDLNMYLTNFQAMTTNAEHNAPYNQVHQTDLQLMQHYGYMNKKVVVVSLYEQAMRVYQNGKLVKAFQVTTGRPERPSPPGTWWVEGKQSPTVFKATVPKSSPYWYPDTPIHFAMQYHSDGYFLHDSWWRADYGPGTNFPHQDSSGDSFSSFGSHGCVNIQESNAAWLYNYVSLYTPVLVY
ncbi:MAG TPA: L,D-transpeptidase [Ktedonobacteraceae bacterium]|nr:L,D-transpeptidase [Ktedonobacteraceae bacterium]